MSLRYEIRQAGDFLFELKSIYDTRAVSESERF